ncbi:hypothetical protein [Heyndrickxia sporothermodurans]
MVDLPDADLIGAVAEALEIKRNDREATDQDLERLSELTHLVTTTPALTDAGRVAKGRLCQTEAADLLAEDACTDLVQSLLRDLVGSEGVLEPDGNLIGRVRIERSPVPPPSALRVEAETLRSADYARQVLDAFIRRANATDDVVLHALARHVAIEVDPMLRSAIQAADRIDYLADMLEPAEPEAVAA